jgi:hypothetical protein
MKMFTNFSPRALICLFASFILALMVISPVCLTTHAADLTLAWDSVNNASGYMLFYGFESNSYDSMIDVGPQLKYKVTGLEDNQLYYFAVKAWNEYGESDYSQEISSKTGPEEPDQPPIIDVGIAKGVNNSDWKVVTLSQSYVSPVVIATANYDNTSDPAVVRIQNAYGNTFEVMVTSAGGADPVNVDVHYMVVEEGVYTEPVDGVKMEAVIYDSTVTDDNNSWVGEAQTFSNSYTSPVVLGQVMSCNDSNFSSFWSQGDARANPPSATTLVTGKSAAEDPSPARANEIVGYVVIEAGKGTINDVEYVAAVGADTVMGVNDAPPYNYTINGLTNVTSAVATITAMDGNNGGWAILYGADPVSASSINLAVDEDIAGDSERNHTTEQVAYIVFRNIASDNNAPFWYSDPVIEIDATEDTTYGSTLIDDADDYENDPLTFARVSGPAWLTVATDGALGGTPTKNDVGLNGWTLQVSDGINIPVEATLNITVLNTNDVPVFDDDPIYKPDAEEGKAYNDSIAGSATDADNDTLTYNKVSGPAWLSIAANGALGGTPTAGDVGANSWTVEVSDGNGGTDTALLNITVNQVATITTHVQSITLSVQNFWFWRRARAEVVIFDSLDATVNGATVKGTFSGDVNQSGLATTDDAGKAVIESSWSTSGISNLSFCVDNITHESLGYTSGDNIETCDSL